MLCKETIRKQYLSHRLSLNEDYLKQQSAKIRKHLYNYILANFLSDQIIAGYYPIKQEVDIVEIYEKLIEKKFQMALPTIEENSNILRFHKILELSDLKTGKYNIKYSPSNIKLIPDIIIIPLIACDKFGNRIGYGKGYYDYSLFEIKKTSKVTVIAPCFNFQVIDNIPALPHDQKINVIITEEKIFNL